MSRMLLPLEAHRLGVDWIPSLGIRPLGQAGAEFVRVHQLRGNTPDTLRIRKAFNLGNHVRQVANAVRLAEALGSRRVELPHRSAFVPGRVGDVEVVAPNERIRPGTLESTFFYYEHFGLTAATLDRARVIRELRRLFPIPAASSEVRHEFVLHLRAGDVFEPNPHPRYGPPPLRFYLESIERSGSTSVVVVTQDVAHPYVGAIRAWTAERGIASSVVASDLASDFAMLRSARALCVSQGTLALAAAWLSPVCDSAYTFERERDEDRVLRELGVRVQSASGHGFPRNWAGSQEQLSDLMSENGVIEWVN